MSDVTGDFTLRLFLYGLFQTRIGCGMMAVCKIRSEGRNPSQADGNYNERTGKIQ